MSQYRESNESLYERIGGEPVVSQLVEALYEQIAVEPELAPFFRHTSPDKFRSMQRELIMSVLNGPEEFFGLSMIEAHKGRGIKAYHFNLFAQKLIAALETLPISEVDIERIIARLNIRAGDVTGDALTSE